MEIADHAQGTSAFALIVGISKYQDESIRQLEYTRADADAVGQLVTDPRRCCIPQERTKILLDSEATLYNIKFAISGWLHRHASEDSTVLVYFAGHGGIESDRTGLEPDGMAKYLLPWDTRRDDLFNSALSNTDFHRLLNTVKARRLVIFMDACYSGGVAERGARDLGIVGNPYERLAEGQGRLVIAASKPNQRSWEDQKLGHGIFTHHLIEALSGKADSDDDGFVSIMEVYKYLERNVSETARRLALGEQEPMLCGSLANDILLTVDTERIRALKSKQAEQARLRQEQIRLKREALFRLFNKGELPSDVFYDTIRLIEKPVEDHTNLEEKLLKFIDLLTQEAITAPFFLDTRTLLMQAAAPDVSKLAREAHQRASTKVARKPNLESLERSSETKLKFCINCGARLNPGTAYCISCGRRIVPA